MALPDVPARQLAIEVLEDLTATLGEVSYTAGMDLMTRRCLVEACRILERRLRELAEPDTLWELLED